MLKEIQKRFTGNLSLLKVMPSIAAKPSAIVVMTVHIYWPMFYGLAKMSASAQCHGQRTVIHICCN